ncbi:Uncharacterized protein with an alpha/beta hydrolase fold [Lentibacillus persicus]|uniref:Uncharacterized protein with an alpha/beta hydrolase fold n=1 Tax=Lentibacillus persicus TaxID=640948 RepID=A0A1I1Y5W7_9BACI|nr:alpha/beta fold hydrolase [Lentibacillus persicus]SFE15015.1 Uncharacterized protein with an alpha/beta hydrolase fold [Lentibacillus persicus]
MQFKYIVGTAVFLILTGSVFGLLYVPESTKSEKNMEVPTVFVHGYKGTENSLGNMLERFEHTYNLGKRSLVYKVSPAGKLDVYHLNNREHTANMFVQPVFKNNRASIEDTAEWLAKVMAHMKETFGVKRVNLVGHSMGGLVSIEYIENYQDYSHYPEVKKLAVIGSPINGIYNEGYFKLHHDPAAEDLKPDSYALKRLRLNKNAIPDHLDVLSIGSTGDSVARPKSIEGIRKIVDEGQLTYKMIKDPTLGHSALHEDTRVDKMIYSFLQLQKRLERTAKD